MKLIILKDETASTVGILLYLQQERISMREIHITVNQDEALSLLKLHGADLIIHHLSGTDSKQNEFEFEVKKIAPECQVIFNCTQCMENLQFIEESQKLDDNNKEYQNSQVIEGSVNPKKIRRNRSICAHHQQILKRRFAVKLLNNEASEQILRQMQQQGIQWQSNDLYQMVLVTFKSHKELTKGHFEQVLRRFEEQLSDFDAICEVRDSKHMFAVVRIASEFTLKDHDAKLDKCMKQFLDGIGVKGLHASTSISKKKTGISHVPSMYRECEKIGMNLFWYGFGSVHRVILPKDMNIDVEEEIYQKFKYHLLKKNQSQLLNLINKLNFILRAKPDQNTKKIAGIYYTLCELLKQHADSLPNEKKESKELFYIHLWEQLSKCETVLELNKYLVDEVNLFFKRTQDLMYGDKTIYEIVGCIQENIGNPGLSVEYIANNVFISPTYLSTVFKKKTGYTVRQYITKERVNKSKELLKCKKTKLHHIAMAVGYNDPNYFSKIFHKQTGFTPSEYRDKFIAAF